MAKYDYKVVIDWESGTFFPLENACILDTRDLTAHELEALNEGSDMQRSEIADDKAKWLPVILGMEEEENA